MNLAAHSTSILPTHSHEHRASSCSALHPAEWCTRLKNRLPLLHLKDYAVDATGKPYFAEIGQGNLDFKAIIAAAEASGCEWFIVEQDVCPGNPFGSLKLSIDYIKARLVG